MNQFQRNLIARLVDNSEALGLSEQDCKVLLAVNAANGEYAAAAREMGLSGSRVKQLADRLPRKIGTAIERLSQRPLKPEPPLPPDRHAIDWKALRAFDKKLASLLQDVDPMPRYWEDVAYLFQSLKTRRQWGEKRLSQVRELVRANCDVEYFDGMF